MLNVYICESRRGSMFVYVCLMTVVRMCVCTAYCMCNKKTSFLTHMYVYINNLLSACTRCVVIQSSAICEQLFYVL
ncbi:hypothetical protein EON63_00450 [archaeon]|nr:MAG: hypothetical protein EON63_00450 [archaeon]